MTWSDEELRSLYQKRTARDAEASGCPSAEALVRVAGGEAGDERTEIVRHVTGCSSCAGELQSALRALKESESTGGAVVLEAHERGARSRGRAWLVAAAALLAALSVPLYLWQSYHVAEDVTRGEAGLDVLPPPDGILPGPPSELSWPEQTGASGYRVRLLDARGEPLWESDPIEQARVALPADVMEAIAQAGDGASFVWVVEVEGAAARELGPFWFRVDAGAARRR